MPVYHANEIIDNLWLGDLHSARDAMFFKEHNISYVVNCTVRHASPTFYDNMEICYSRLPIYDSRDKSNMNYFKCNKDRYIEQIHSFLVVKKPVLIHCVHGIQRSASLVVFYLMKKFNIDACVAMKIIKDKRQIAFGLEPTFKDIF